MNTTNPLQQDNPNGDTSETLHQEIQKTCSRNSPCHLQGCMICCTPTNHVRNLDDALSNDVATRSLRPPRLPSTSPQPPHPGLTHRFRTATQINDVQDIEVINQLYQKTLHWNINFLIYDCSALCAAAG